MSEVIAAIVFDLDGVLIESESVWDAARREVVARNGGAGRRATDLSALPQQTPKRPHQRS
jgi:beta-phosphoglucomutase-like phosphatase (HAD superfamily)